MPEKSIISRPVYGILSPQPGREHLFIADAEGGEAILDLAKIAPAGFFETAHLLYVPGGAGDALIPGLKMLSPETMHISPSLGAAIPRLKQTLATARMGLRLYLSGTEGLIGQAMQLALDAGIDHTSIQTEHRGSLKRRVQCVHCKGVTENVTMQPAECAHCGLLLFVRDHYSRRLAAFQGVCINAEDQSEIPPKQEAFP